MASYRRGRKNLQPSCISVNLDDVPYIFIFGLDDELEDFFLSTKEEEKRKAELEEFVALFQGKSISEGLRKFFTISLEEAREELDSLSERDYVLVLNSKDKTISWYDNVNALSDYIIYPDDEQVVSLIEKIVTSGIPYTDCSPRVRTSPGRISPSRERISPSRERISPSRERISPSRERISPSRERISPSRERISPSPVKSIPPLGKPPSSLARRYKQIREEEEF
ncbi:hypothetical protein BQ9231_00181 [Cedratvirus lausannensis]|uniref:Uncharacterized protein n=1 Tax=Cedratvirus lausannensis TaxID=2023205 RepID=A0A285PWR3_9VIRU|nr:hypothetical protein BQ9231_00181 [Cedratvirus lausannensis]